MSPAGASGAALGARPSRLSGPHTVRGKKVFLEIGDWFYYRRDGGYEYHFANDGPIHHGHWSVDGEGRICVVFEDPVKGRQRCDTFVNDNGKLFIENARGYTYRILKITN